MITTREIAWCAGFLEGEGCFSLHSKNGGIMVSALQVQKEPLDKLYRVLGGKMSFRERKNKNPKNSDVWAWWVTGPRAASIMMTLYPFLSLIRKEQIKKALNVWKKIPPVGSRYVLKCKNGHALDDRNTRISITESRRKRTCRTCAREHMRKKRLVIKNDLIE